MKAIKRISLIVLVLFIFLNVLVAFHAYKFTHFYDLNTTVKKPEQMTGWEKAGVIMFGVDYPKKKIIDLPSTPYSTFTVRTEDGLNLKGWSICPKPKEQAKGAVILFHGHAGNKGVVIKEAEAFEQLGYCVYLVDFRAHGESDGNICTIGYKESMDVKATYDYVQKTHGGNIILWGISLGAATITKAMADYPEIKPAKVILEMPFGTLGDAVNGRLRTMHLPEEPLSTLLTFWGGTQQGFWGFSHKPTTYVRKITCPVLVQWGVNDPRVSKKEIHDIYYNLSSSKKYLVKYITAAHESLFKKEPEKWISSVSAFLAQ